MFLIVRVEETRNIPLFVLETMFVVYAENNPPKPRLDMEGLARWIEGAPEPWKHGFDRIAGVNETLADQWVFSCLEKTGHFVFNPFSGQILQTEVFA